MLDQHTSILIADDDKIDRKTIIRALKKSGFAGFIEEANTVDEAIRICDDRQIDCVFMDYRMPGKSGLDGLSSLLQSYPHLTIILVTGQGDENVAREAFKRGASDYLPKPYINAESVRRVIENSLEKKRLQNFGRILVHDLRAPLRGMNHNIQFLKMAFEEQDMDSINKYFDRLNRAVKNMDNLIVALDDYNKLHATPVQMEEVDTKLIVNEVLSSMAPMIEETGAIINISDDLPIITSSAPLLHQLIQNLISNAIKYSGQNTPDIQIHAIHTNGFWEFSVKDNGIGIPDEHLERVFEPFKRLPEAKTISGSGLGLATCKKIVERLGGTIYCEPANGEGTKCTFRLPKDI